MVTCSKEVSEHHMQYLLVMCSEEVSECHMQYHMVTCLKEENKFIKVVSVTRRAIDSRNVCL